jgi:tetratricopeptide (TPR) repeat protein
VRVLRQPRNLGFAGGVNAGIREARGELVLVLNNDTQAAPNLLHELAAVLASDERMGATAPLSNHVKGHALLAVGGRGKTAAGRVELLEALRTQAPVQDAPTLAGLCLLVRRSTFERIGCFDERFGHGNFEDDDFCLRLRLHGLRLGIAARTFLHHEGHATFKHLGLDLQAQLAQRLVQFAAKWRDDPAGRAYVAALAGDHERAAAAALAARQCWPEWPDADWHLGTWLAQRGEHARARVHLRALLRQCPHHVDAKIALVRSCLQLGDERAAAALLETIAGDAPTAGQQAMLLRTVAGHHYERGDCERALASFEAALDLAPGDGVVHNWIGACHLAAQRVADAAPHFERAATAGVPIAWSNLGICRAREGRLDEARAHFARAVELLPGDATARNNAAMLPVA